MFVDPAAGFVVASLRNDNGPETAASNAMIAALYEARIVPEPSGISALVTLVTLMALYSARSRREAKQLLSRMDDPVINLHERLIGHLTAAELKQLTRLLEKARESGLE
jgi:hypothetical protein